MIGEVYVIVIGRRWCESWVLWVGEDGYELDTMPCNALRAYTQWSAYSH